MHVIDKLQDVLYKKSFRTWNIYWISWTSS